MIARIITMMNPSASAAYTPVCTSYLHSKFVRRKKYVEEILRPQIEKFGIETDLFPAIVDTDFERVGNDITYKDLRLVVEYGIVGCYLSHVMLWRLCVEKDCPLLVLEDDALLPAESESNIASALKEYESLPDSGDILYLLGQLPYIKVGLHNYAEHTLKPVGNVLRRAYPVHDMSGTAAYAIRPAAAKKLLERVPKVPTIAVDGFIHGTVKAKEVSVVVPANFKNVFMLDDHFGSWNHIHTPAE